MTTAKSTYTTPRVLPFPQPQPPHRQALTQVDAMPHAVQHALLTFEAQLLRHERGAMPAAELYTAFESLEQTIKDYFAGHSRLRLAR